MKSKREKQTLRENQREGVGKKIDEHEMREVRGPDIGNNIFSGVFSQGC